MLCMMRYHARVGQHQYLTQLLRDRFGVAVEEEEMTPDSESFESSKVQQRSKVQQCTLGNQYPILQSMIAPGLFQREKVTILYQF
jgi:hypothetical protein